MLRKTLVVAFAFACFAARAAHADDDPMLPPPSESPPVAAPPATPPPVTPPTPPSTPPPAVDNEAPLMNRMPKPVPSSVHLVLELKLPLQYTVNTGAIGTSDLAVAPLPELLIGLRAGRVTVELGFGIAREATRLGGVIDTTQETITEFVVAPVLALDLFQSRDRKMALYALGAPLFGAVTESAIDSNTTAIYGFLAGFGVRLAVHRNLTLGLESGVTGQYFHLPTSSTNSVGVTSVFAALAAGFVAP